MDADSTGYYVDRLNYINYTCTTMKRYEEAITGYKEVLDIDPKNLSAAFNLAVCYYVHEHNISKTYGQLQKVIEIDPASRLADKAKYYIDYLRRNPDERFVSDFTFIEEG
jgi:tetratricopeptide (TPR) repeat protein